MEECISWINLRALGGVWGEGISLAPPSGWNFFWISTAFFCKIKFFSWKFRLFSLLNLQFWRFFFSVLSPFFRSSTNLESYIKFGWKFSWKKQWNVTQEIFFWNIFNNFKPYFWKIKFFRKISTIFCVFELTILAVFFSFLMPFFRSSTNSTSYTKFEWTFSWKKQWNVTQEIHFLKLFKNFKPYF